MVTTEKETMRQFQIRMPAELMERVTKRAQSLGLNTASYVRMILKEAVDEA